MSSTSTWDVLTVINGWTILTFRTQGLVGCLTYGALIAVIRGGPLQADA